jgi:hypothetical protein
MHGRWWLNHPGALSGRSSKRQSSDAEAQALTTLVGLTGGHVFLSDDLDAIPRERREMVAAILPPLLDGMDVADLFQEELPTVVVAPVARSWGRWQLVALFNWQDDPVERELPEAISLSTQGAYHVVDFWERRYLLMAPGALRPVVHIPALGVVLLSIRPTQPDPHLVATTFHVSQGGEVQHWRVEGASVEMSLAIDRYSQGEVWVALPGRPVRATLNDEPLGDNAIRAVASGVWAVAFRLDREGILGIRWSEPGGAQGPFN